MASLRETLRKPSAKAAVIPLIIIVIGAATWQIYSALGNSEAISQSTHSRIICADTGKAFDLTLKEGMTFPVQSPFSGKKTGYPAESCYWTKDGKLKKEPTPVLLNSWLGKRDPTFCPDCGRLVVPHNPAPTNDLNPPPLRDQYRNRSDS